MPSNSKIRDKWLWTQSVIVVISSCLLAIVLDGALASHGAASEPNLPAKPVTVSTVPSEPAKGV